MERRNFLAAGLLGGAAVLTARPAAWASGPETAPPAAPFYIAPRGPLAPGPGNVDVRTLVHAAQTNGQFSNVEVAVGPKQMGPAPHLHHDLDELMYVVEGTATVMIGKEIYEVKAGGWNFRPRGVPHTFWNATNGPLRFIDCFFNQNFEDYLDELFHRVIPDMLQKKLTPAAPEIAARLAALDQKFGVTWFHEQRQPLVDKYGLKA